MADLTKLRSPLGPLTVSRARPEYRKPLDEEDSDSVMRSLVGHSTGALQYGLDLLDKPGRAVRGLLGGKPGELLAAVPFSDSLGLTDPENKVSGRDLTDKVGLTNRRSKDWLAGLAGVGAEILTDPLSYSTFGAKHALAPSGKALKNMGVLRGPEWTRKAMLRGFEGTESHLRSVGATASDIGFLREGGKRIATKEMEDAVLKATGKPLQAGQPLGALASLSVPFTKPQALIGQGEWAQKIAGGLDRASEKLKYGTRLGRWSNSLFDSEVGEATGRRSQKAMANYGTPAAREVREAARRDVSDLTNFIDHGMKPRPNPSNLPAVAGQGAQGFGEDELLRAAIQSAEGARIRPRGSVSLTPGVVDPELGAAAGKVAGVMRRSSEGKLAREQAIGLPLDHLADGFVDYAPRHGIDIAEIQRRIEGAPGRAGLKPQVIDRNNLPVAAGDNFHRDPVLRDVPGGRKMIDDWAVEFAGNPNKLDLGTMESRFRRDMALEYVQSGGRMSPELAQKFDEKAAAMARYMARKSPLHSEHQIGVFGDNMVADLARSGEQHARKMQAGNMIMGYIGDNAVPYAKGSDNIPIATVLRQLGLRTLSPNGGPLEGALVAAHRSLARRGAANTDNLVNGTRVALRKRVNRYALTPDAARELLETHKAWSQPQVLKDPMKVFDDLTSTFKSLAYPIWPASHVRNAFSAGLNNLTMGTGLGAHIAQFKLMRGTLTADEARRFVPSVPPGISDEGAREFLRREQFASGKIFDGHSGQFDLDNGVAARLQGQTGGRTTPAPFGSDRTGGGSMARDTANLIGGGARDLAGSVFGNRLRNPFGPGGPLEMAGVWAGRADNPALATGRAVGSNIEDFFRGANFLGNTRAGMTTTEAGRGALGLHFDYDALTDFEKKWARRLVPFYTFSRKNLPLRASWLTHNPAATVAQMRAMDAGRDGEYLPDYLASGFAAPTGPEVDGKRQFVSGLGTPLEEALDRFKFKGGMPDLRGTAFAFAANANPLLKAPIEQLFNLQFHTGRKLSDLRAPSTASAIGRLFGEDNPQLLSQILVNSPATRFITSIDRALDPRKSLASKAINLGTGMKITDVDLEKAKASEAAAARNEILASMPNVRSYTNFYVKPDQKDQLRPDEMQMLRMLATMQAASRAYAKEQKRIGIQSAP